MGDDEDEEQHDEIDVSMFMVLFWAAILWWLFMSLTQ